VIDRVPDEGRWASFFDVVCRSWSSGRVAVIGDAAHAMSPNLGQGACTGMANGIALAQALDHFSDVERGLEAWETSERPITDATQRYSRFYGRIGTRWPHRLLNARSAMVWMLSRSKRFQRRANIAAHHTPRVGAVADNRIGI
jgi:2-polyprenyl-6-methoxyphenol hydroxylase-like FAD-dependent oxidoreductase